VIFFSNNRFFLNVIYKSVANWDQIKNFMYPELKKNLSIGKSQFSLFFYLRIGNCESSLFSVCRYLCSESFCSVHYHHSMNNSDGNP